MTTVKEPIRTKTNVPRPQEAPVFAPARQPVGIPEEQTTKVPVPVRRLPSQG